MLQACQGSSTACSRFPQVVGLTEFETYPLPNRNISLHTPHSFPSPIQSSTASPSLPLQVSSGRGQNLGEGKGPVCEAIERVRCFVLFFVFKGGKRRKMIFQLCNLYALSSSFTMKRDSPKPAFGIVGRSYINDVS